MQSLDEDKRCDMSNTKLFLTSYSGFFETRFGSSINNHIAFAPESASSVEPRLLVCNNDNLIRVFRVGLRTEHPGLDLVATLKFNTAINQGL